MIWRWDLQRRLAEVERQPRKRNAGDRKAADTAAKKFTVRPIGRIHTVAAAFSQDHNNQFAVGDVPDLSIDER